MIKKLFISILFLCFVVKLSATHLMGGFMSYEYLGKPGNNYVYRVTIKMYRDCKGSTVPFEKSAMVCVYNGNKRLYTTYDFKIVSETKVNPIGNTNCPEVKNSCIKEGIYEGQISLPSSLTGYYLIHKTCCRNKQVNLTNDGSGQAFQGQTYSAFIQPTHIKNSSPFFSEIPVPFFCINDTTTIRNTAIDPDGDSLVFRAIKPHMGINVTQWGSYSSCNTTEAIPPSRVIYRPGYSEAKPFGTGGYHDVNSRTGLATLFSKKLGNFAFCIEVSEYRNGVLLSTVRLDYQLLVINCQPNKKPQFTSNTSSQVLRFNAGESKCYDIEGVDPDNHNIRITGIGNLLDGTNGFKGTKATLKTVQGKGPLKTELCWKPDCDQARAESYLATVEVLDDGCPAKYINKIFEIYVDSFKSNIGITGTTKVCKNSIYEYLATSKGANSTLNWSVEGGTLVSGQGTTKASIKWDVVGKGKVIIEEISEFGCSSPIRFLEVDIEESPAIPLFNKDIDTLCLNSDATFSHTDLSLPFREWFVENCQIIGSNTGSSVQIKFNQMGNAIIKLVTKNGTGCPSDTGFIRVFVPSFSLGVINGPDKVCPNNKNFEYNIAANPGSKYHWSIVGGSIQSGNLSNSILVNWGNAGTGILKVVEENKFGCFSDTIKINITKTYILNAYKITGPLSVCEKQNIIHLYNSYVTNGKYDWKITGGTEVNNDSLNSVNVIWGDKGQGKVWLQYLGYDSINNRQCESAPDSLIVDIRALPTANEMVGTMKYCQFDPIAKFTLNGFANSTYEWTINGSASITGQGTNSIEYPTDVAGTYTIQVTEISEYNCNGTPIDTTFIIHPKPTTTVIIGAAPICFPDYSNTDYNYSVTGLANSTFSWIINNGNILNNNGNNIDIRWNGPTDGRLALLETSEFGCKGDSQILNVPLDNPNIFLKYVTVNPPEGDDNSILIYWTLNNAPRYNTKIYIYRRDNGSTSFTLIDSVDKAATSYRDVNVSPKEKAYDYKVVGYNICSYPIESVEHTSILLTGNKVGTLGNDINFTAYVGWANGVKEYEVHRKVNEGTFELYDNSITTQTFAYENGKDGYSICYRIRAKEDGDSNFTSWSNEKCFIYEPVIFVPNAFSPGDNNSNDVFKYVASSVKSFKMQIFNRWGEKLFETTDNERYWDGIYQNKLAQAGVYVYLLEFTDYQDKLYKLNGTVHLIR